MARRVGFGLEDSDRKGARRVAESRSERAEDARRERSAEAARQPGPKPSEHGGDPPARRKTRRKPSILRIFGLALLAILGVAWLGGPDAAYLSVERALSEGRAPGELLTKLGWLGAGAVLILLMTRGGRAANDPHDDDSSSSVEMPKTRAGRLGAAVFLLIWLSLWTTGIVVAAAHFWLQTQNGEDMAVGFLGVWLVAAMAGWVVAVWQLLRLLFGR